MAWSVRDLTDAYGCGLLEELLVQRALRAGCMVTHRLVVVGVDVADSLRVEIALLLKDLIQVNIIISGSLA